MLNQIQHDVAGATLFATVIKFYIILIWFHLFLPLVLLTLQNGMTQFTLGEKINMDQRQIAYIEGGNCFPSLRTLKNLSEVFNCSLKDLFDYEHLMGNEVLRKEIYQKVATIDDNRLKIYYSVLKAIETAS